MKILYTSLLAATFAASVMAGAPSAPATNAVQFANKQEASIPLYVFLKERAPGDMTSAIKWNFTKFLVSRDGGNITRHASAVTPESLEKPIEALLGEERP